MLSDYCHAGAAPTPDMPPCHITTLLLPAITLAIIRHYFAAAIFAILFYRSMLPPPLTYAIIIRHRLIRDTYG